VAKYIKPHEFEYNYVEWALKQDEILYLAKIIGDDQVIRRINLEGYITINIIEKIEKNDDGDERVNISFYNGGSFKILFISDTLEEARKNFEELKKQKPYSDWVFDKDVKNYNL
jgi:poly(3-hydroxyalkanoate) synthetase